MKKHYDFSKSVKNPYLSKAKKQLTIRLDEDTVAYFKSLAEEQWDPLPKFDQPLSSRMCRIRKDARHEVGIATIGMDDPDRKARAERRRQTISLHQTTLQRTEADLTPVSGLAAVALVEILTRESRTAARKPTPSYRREEIPVRFVPYGLT